MEQQFKIRAKLYADQFPLQKRLDETRSSLRGRLPEKNVRILDIGCGHSQEILDLIHYNNSYTFTAIDSDLTLLELLKADLLLLGPRQTSRVEMLQGEFPNLQIPYEEYDALMFHNIFHFFQLNELIKIWNSIHQRIKSGALISVRVHSTKHPSNAESNKKSYFKHFFSLNDLKKIFPSEYYNLELQAIIDMRETEENLKFKKDWCRAVYVDAGMTDEHEILQRTDAYMNSTTEYSHFIEYIIRRK